MTKPSLSIVGAGRVGSAVAKNLSRKGWQIEYVFDRAETATKKAVRFIGRGKSAKRISDILKSRIILMAVSDDALSPLAKEIARVAKKFKTNIKGKIFIHTSGVHSSEILKPLKKLGAEIGSVHPLQSIPSAQAGVKLLRECFYATEGSAKASSAGRSIVKDLGGKNLKISSGAKPLYHISAVMASNYLITLLHASFKVAKRAGVTPDALPPLILGTLSNALSKGAKNALTGPVARGDEATIKMHINVLKRRMPEILPLYRALGMATLEMVKKKLPRKRFSRIRKLFR